jgi:dTDP-4-dehydrorhamnose 3,5-epimerase
MRLSGLLVISPTLFPDARGLFFEAFQQERYRALGLPDFVQDNCSVSKKGVVRALHFQAGEGQAKLVSCLAGKIWDVAVDMRPGSSTYGEWEAVELSGDNRLQFFIPEGFAHGFCALEESLVLYKVNRPYSAPLEKTVRWNDPELAIPWPISHPLLSERDQAAPCLREALEC